MTEAFGLITTAQDAIQARFNPTSFVGRQWLIKEIEKFIADEHCRHFIIVGEPGSGKSALVAYLAQQWNCVRHFIRVDSIGSVTGTDPRHFLISIGAQLYQKYGREIFDSQNSCNTSVNVGLARDRSEVVGRFIEELYTLPFLPLEERDVHVRVAVASGQSRVVGEHISRMINAAALLDEKTLLQVAVLDPVQNLHRLHPMEKIVMLIDALDEAHYHSGTSIVSVIPYATDVDALPNLRIVMTSRPDDLLLRFRAEDQLHLDAPMYSSHNQADVRAYIDQRLTEAPLSEYLSVWKRSEIDDFKDQIEMNSEGNFLYLVYLFNELVSTERGKLRQVTLPRGLDEIYRIFAVEKIRQNMRAAIQFSLVGDVPEAVTAKLSSLPTVSGVQIQGNEVAVMTTDKGAVLPQLFTLGIPITNLRLPEIGIWEEKYLPILGILSVAFDALTRRQLSQLSGVPQPYVDSLISSLRQFLDEVRSMGEDFYQIYHRSFGDYLLDPSRNREYPIDGDAQHQHIVSDYRGTSPMWDAVDWSKVDDYGLRHLTDHLYALRHLAAYRQEFQRVICKPFMQAKRIREGSHRAFAANVSLAITLSGDETPPDLVSQIRNAVLYATLGTVANNIPGEILASVAFSGKADDALDMAVLISDAQRRSSACFLIAKTLLKSGDTKNLTSALNRGLTALLNHIYDLMGKQSVSNNAIAEWLHDAAVFFDQAVMLDRFFSTYYRFIPAGLLNTMAILADNLAQKGQNPLAIHVAEAVKQWLEPNADLPEHADDFVYLARAFALSGEHQRAIEAAERAVALINQRGDTTELIWLAPVFVHAGQIDRALQVAETIADSDAQDQAYREIAEALTRSHQNDRALQIAQTIRWGKMRWDALVKVAASYADDGEFERGLGILETIEYPVQYGRALTGITLAMVRAKKFAEAQTALQRLDGLDSRRENGPRDIFGKPESVDKNFVSSYLLSEIALGMASAGMGEQAKPIALRAAEDATLVEGEDNSFVMCLAAEALSALRLFEQVMPMLPLISDVNERCRAVATLMKAMTAQGMYEAAHDLLRSFNEAASLSAGVEALARAHIQANKVDEAIRLVDMVPIAWNKALVIGALITELIDRNDSERAARLLEQALLITEVNEDNTALLRLIPKICALLLEKGKTEAVDELADEVIELANRQITSEQAAEGYAASAEVCLMLGDISKATDAINSMEQLTVSQDSQLRLVLNIAQSAKGSAQSPLVIQLLNAVLPIIQAISTAREQSAWLVEVVQALSTVSAFEAALQMAGKITNRLHKALASCILARGFTREGMTEVASDLLGYAMQAAEDDFSGWESEGQQIHFYSNDTVKYLSNYADAEHQRAEALSELALTLTAVGRMKDAADVALRAEVLAGKQARVSPICKVIEALARAGLPEKAESLYVEAEGQLVKIEDVAPRALAWVDLAHARMLLDQADKARICLENSVNLLTSASYYTRSDIFQVVSASAPIIAQWEDGQVLWEMCRAILEVEKWWN